MSKTPQASTDRALIGTSLVLFGLVLVGLATAPCAALPPEKDRWIELSAPRFTLYSASSRASAREIAQHLEQLRAVLERYTSWDVDATMEAHIYVFRDDASFTPYKNSYGDKKVEGAGYLLARPDSNFIAINGGSPDPEKLLHHEYVHHVLSYNVRRIPLWLNEGLAEYYSTFAVSGRRAELGRPIAEHLALLRRSELIPLDELFAIDTTSAEYNEGARRGVFYAQSWGLVHNLMIGNPEREGELSRYLEWLTAGRDVKQAFNAALGTDDATIEKELRGYVRRGELPASSVSVGALDAAAFEVRTMAYPEVLRRLGDLLVRLERYDTAAEHFQAALERQRASAMALAGLADVARYEERYDNALALYTRALDSPIDPTRSQASKIHYRYGECLLAMGEEDSQARSEAVRALRRSVELQPRFAPARVLLARTLAAGSDPSERALRDVESAYELLAYHPDVAGALLLIYAKRGDRDAARQLFESYFANRAEPTQRSWAHGVVLDIEERIRSAENHQRWSERYDEAVSLAQSGQLEAAQGLLEELAEASEGSRAEAARTWLERIRRQREIAAASERVNLLLAEGRPEEAIEELRRLDIPPDSADGRWVEEQIGHIRRKSRSHRFNERFNDAMGRLRVGDAREACRILEDLLAGLPQESPEAERARVLLGKARAELKRRGG